MTTETKHTPGPWVIDEWHRDGFYKIRSAKPYEDVLCHTHSFADSDDPTTEAAANARLIAAAPEMKEALAATMAALGCDGDSCDSNGAGVCPKCRAWATAFAALRKATAVPV